MKVKEFNQLKKQVKGGNVEGLKEVISDLTLSQAQTIEDILMDLPLDDEMNKVLDEIVIHIDSLTQAEKVANKKAPQKQPKTEKTEVQAPTKEAPTKEAPEKQKNRKTSLFNKVNVGDTVHFRVEDEEVNHDIRIIYKGKTNIIAIMVEDETEVFNIRKQDFNKGIFSWRDRHGEEYNIIVTLK